MPVPTDNRLDASESLSKSGVGALISASESEAIAMDLFSKLKGSEAQIQVLSGRAASASFANNEIRELVGIADKQVSLTLSLDGHQASGSTHDVTVGGLSSLLDEVRDSAKHHRETKPEGLLLGPGGSFKDPLIYFESMSAGILPETQGDLIRTAAALSDRAGFLGAGDLLCSENSLFVLNTNGLRGYTRSTYGQFSMTVRTPKGGGSGWAWKVSEDFAEIHVNEVAQRAIGIAKQSENPVAVEPGRYTVIMEPEAVDELVFAIIGSGLDLESIDMGDTPFSLQGGGNKLGKKMTDDRVQIFSDPTDPLLPSSPLNPDGWILGRTYWIQNGVLANLACQPSYARKLKRKPLINPFRARLEVVMAPQTLEQMIASTKRGVWIHRFGNMETANPLTLLMTGVTRDGTFLIEDGRVTKAIKNMRFSESPFFVLNKLEAAGPSVRGGTNFVCPRLKVHDFEFTSLTDAI